MWLMCGQHYFLLNLPRPMNIDLTEMARSMLDISKRIICCTCYGINVMLETRAATHFTLHA